MLNREVSFKRLGGDVGVDARLRGGARGGGEEELLLLAAPPRLLLVHLAHLPPGSADCEGAGKL